MTMFFSKKEKKFTFELVNLVNVERRFIEDELTLMDYLEEQNEELQSREEVGSVGLQKFDEAGELYAQETIHFPFEESVETLLEEFIHTTKKKPSKKGKASKKEEVVPAPGKSTPKKEVPVNPLDEPTEEELEEIDSREVPEPAKETPSVKQAPRKAPAPPEEYENDNTVVVTTHKRQLPLQKILKGVVGLLLVFLLAGAGVLVVPKLLTPSYQDLVDTNQFAKAVQLYPEKRIEVERQLFDKGVSEIGYLEAYVHETGSTSAEFDLAYLTQDFEKVVSLKQEATTPIRKTELAVSYVKTGQLDEAYDLNQTLSSSKLTELITNAYRQKGIDLLKEWKVEEAETIVSKIPQSDLAPKVTKVKTTLQQEKEVQEKLKNTSLSTEEKEALEKQLTQLQTEKERYKKGEF